jgi:hypothetical protein
MVDISKSNKAPMFKTSTVATINELKRMASNEGLAFILSNNDAPPEMTAPYTNSDHAYTNFINSLGWAESINASDIRTVAKVTGEKFLKTSTYPGFYVAGDRPALNEVNRSCFLDYGGTQWVVMGNWGPNAMGREHLYSAINFKNGLPNSMEQGWQTAADGWVMAPVAKAHEGTDDLSKNYMHVSTVDDAYDSYYELKYENQKNQAIRKCGAGKENWCGTCCLYYKENHYDSVAGVLRDAGDLYKCSHGKCYHCLEIAKALDMDYVFNTWKGGPNGLTGDECLSCSEEDMSASKCGPCSCKIEVKEKYDRILEDPHLPERGIAKQNAYIAKEWAQNLKGSSFCSLRGSFESLAPDKKLISEAFWGADKSFELPGILLNPESKPTVVELVTQGNKGSEEIIGLRIIQVGQYMDVATVPIDYIKKIWPNADEEYFRVTTIGDAHKNIELITGPVLPMMKKRIMFKDIYEETDISKFDSYGIAVLKDINGMAFFPSSTASKQTARLTYRNIMSTTSSSSDSGAKKTFSKSSESSKSTMNSSTASQSTSTGSSLSAVKVANVKTLSDASTRRVELYVGNDASNSTAIITDSNGDKWTTTSSELPTSKITGAILSPKNTQVILTNNKTINVPTSVSKVVDNQVLSSASMDIEMVIGQSEG